MIRDNIKTWEERAIEQSCVERVAWPDLFHVAVYSLRSLKGILAGLKVYPENMLREVYESRGVYASSEAKEFLKRHLASKGLSHEDVYRIVQLASFNVFEPSSDWKRIHGLVPESYNKATVLLRDLKNLKEDEIVSIRELIPQGGLRSSDDLDVIEVDIGFFNKYLKELFADSAVLKEWQQLFDPELLLRREAFLYNKILGK